MTCAEVQRQLERSFVQGGVEAGDGVAWSSLMEHTRGCPDCRQVYQRLFGAGQRLAASG